MNKKLHLVSLGCTKNLVDSEVMLGKLSNYELSDESHECDVIIVNTCGFIQSAKEESIKTILDLHKTRKKDSVLVMAGCMSQRYKDDLYKELIEVDIFTGVGDYDKIDELIQQKQKNTFTDTIFLANDTNDRVISGSNYHAYIKISEGCNQTCSFCAIPQFKGKLYSRDLQSIKKEVQALVKKGFYDFTFVSQDSSSYLRDHDINDGLQRLIDTVESVEGVKSARILYLYPSTTTFDLIDKIKNSKVFHNYFDMPIQHISQSVLKNMKRGKGAEKLKELLEYMKAVPNSFIRTTFIVGYPNETKKDFEELCSFVEEFNFDRVNIFSYSHEEGTSAFAIKNTLDQNTIDKRAQILGDLVANKQKANLNDELDKTFDIVIDGISDEHDTILSAKKLLWAPEIDGEIYITDNETSDKIKHEKIYKAQVIQIAGDNLIAKIV